MAGLTNPQHDPAQRPGRRKSVRRLGLAAALIVVSTLAVVVLWPAVMPSSGEMPTRLTLAYAFAPAETPSDAASQIAARLGESVVAEVLHLTAAGLDRPLARVEVARLPDDQVHLLSWRSLGALPLLRRDTIAAEELQLVEALVRHLPPGSTILAFPHLSARLSALVEARYPMMGEPEPLFVPPAWRNEAAAIATAESDVWSATATAGIADGPVAQFIDALLAEDVYGAARLRVLAGTGAANVYVLVHLGDIFQIGLLHPGRLEITRREFVGEGFSHGLARDVRAAAQAGGHAAWAVDRSPEGRIRGHFLTDRAETATLIAQLLPFNTSRLDLVPGARLVWQGGGYHLYRLTSAADD